MGRLVITRKENESIIINGGEIVVQFTEYRQGQARIAVTAPDHIVIDREEVHWEKMQDEAKTD